MLASGEVRKIVTIMFTDLVASTAMGERLDPETVRAVMDRYFQVARSAIEHHGGIVEKFIGDAVMAVFGVPLAHEDDPLRAARASLELTERLWTLNEELESSYGIHLQIRTGICTGEVLAGSPDRGERIVTGDPVNVAARLEQAAQPDAILLGEASYRLLRGAVHAQPVPPLDLKGKREPMPAWRLLDIAPDAEPLRRHLEMPLVGRIDELDIMAGALARARRARSPHVVTVLGAPGVGKTRFIHEAIGRMTPPITVLQGRVQAYGERATFRPLVEMLQDLVDEPLERLLAGSPGGDRAALTLSRLIHPDDVEADLDEIPRAMRMLVEAVGKERPLVLVIDDVHWAEPPMLELIDHLARRARDTMLLLVCIARTELLDTAPGAGTLIRGATTIELEPLDRDQSEQVVANLLGGGTIDPALVGRVTDTCEGNPLFLEHFVGSLLDDGSLHRDGEVWVMTRELEQIPVPGSVTAVLESRLERLPARERDLLERAAIEGMRFHVALLHELTPSSERPAVGQDLQTLVRRGLIRSDPPSLPGSHAFRFAHVLVHEAAYARLPKATRADHHERYADLLTAACASLGIPFEDTIGWHLEQAYRLYRELGLREEHVHELGLRAGDALEAAARRAEERGDDRAACDLYMRAAELPAASEVEHGRRLLDATLNARDLDVPLKQILDVLDRADLAVALTGDRSLAVRAHAQRSEVTGAMAEQRLPYDRDIETAQLERALADPRIGERARDEARWSLWMLLMDRGDVPSLYRLAEEMLEETDARSSLRRRRRAVGVWSTTVWVGRRDAVNDLRRLRGFAERWRADPRASFELAGTETVLLALMGRKEEAMDARQRQLASGREAELLTTERSDPLTDAIMAFAEGNLDRAIRFQEETIRSTDARGASGYASSSRFELARMLLFRGRDHDLVEATEVLEQARRQHVAGDMLNEIYLPECRSLLATRRGDISTALREARSAISVADTTGWLWRQADARVALAFALSAAGRQTEADEVADRALALYEGCGLRALVDRAREFLSRTTTHA